MCNNPFTYIGELMKYSTKNLSFFRFFAEQVGEVKLEKLVETVTYLV